MPNSSERAEFRVVLDLPLTADQRAGISAAIQDAVPHDTAPQTRLLALTGRRA